MFKASCRFKRIEDDSDPCHLAGEAVVGASADPIGPDTRIIVVDPNEPSRNDLCELLKDHACLVIAVRSLDAGLQVLRGCTIDAMFCPVEQLEPAGPECLHLLHETAPQLALIVTATLSQADQALRAIRHGATECLFVPFNSCTIYESLSYARVAKQRQANLDRCSQVVQERLEEAESLNRKLSSKAQDLERLAHNMLDEMKRRLRVVLGFSEMLDTDYADQGLGKAQNLLTYVRKEANRMNDMVVALLQMSHIDEQQVILNPVDTRALVEDIVRRFRPDRNEIEVTIGDLPVCRGDACLLKHIFSNLLSNAFKCTRHTTAASIEVSSVACGDTNVYVVRDNGIGFPMEHASRIFSPFCRIHDSDDYDGIGLGLALVHRALDRHDGRIWVQAEPGHGAAFFFTLPAL